MKKLVDTCGWIEWLTNGKLAATFEPYLTKITELMVPTLIQFELYKWVCREKNANLALEIIGITERAQVIPLDTNLALYAADISKEHNLAMADAVIYATARKQDALLITSDKHFQALPHVKWIEKK
jgi:predicted nucleic acid-binding protein